ncbi:CRISPR-associated protein Cas6 [Hydrogenothermus marinus]|uniref:CRISPR-associated endoribonuclease Cas6 n=1 Tax=Hydrogenothermus marinus TaxID=133270 RepID=A0A3M0BYD7_9AQUI|nr:CRISPR-associated protein Cas6 [Hydrogenothermus marinus]RMB00039.1 CRISPR-associated endoribonuclease Cas6 [Hydrogenothermus marinus]
MIDFEFSRIRLEYTALSEFQQPYFLGPAIRDVFDRRLKKMVCIKPGEECITCEFNKTCPYTIIFETEIYLKKPSKYVLQPEYDEKDLKEGDKIYIDITLLGFASNFWQFIIQSLSTVINLGKDSFIKQTDAFYYHPFADKYFPLKSEIPRFNASYFFDLKTGRDELQIKFYPTSLKLNGEYIMFNEFDKNIFIEAIKNRISNVAVNYGTKTEKIFINKSKFEITDLNLKPAPVKKWSNRKKRKMTIPVIEGNFKIKGDLSEIYPYLTMIENINIGKEVNLGLGKVEVKF